MIRRWLDRVRWLEHGKRPCGCKMLGGGSFHACSAQHAIAYLRPDTEGPLITMPGPMPEGDRTNALDEPWPDTEGHRNVDTDTLNPGHAVGDDCDVRPDTEGEQDG